MRVMISLLVALFVPTGTAVAQPSNPYPWFNPTSPTFPRSTAEAGAFLDPRQNTPLNAVSHGSSGTEGSRQSSPLPLQPPSHRVDKTKLRKLADLSVASVSLEWDFDSNTNILNPQAAAKRIAVLEKELQGDATDAERYGELAELYEGENRPEKATAAIRDKAKQLFEERIKSEPANGWLHAQLASILWPDEAAIEMEALEAVRCSPKDYRCLQTLGGIRFRQVIQQFLSTEPRSVLPKKGLSLAQLVERIWASQVSPEQVKQAERLLQESSNCFDKAVALAPEELEVYQWRLDFQVRAGYLRCVLSKQQHQPLPDCRRGFQETDIFGDMRQIARLRPDDPEILSQEACLHWAEAMLVEMEGTSLAAAGADLNETRESCDLSSKEAKKCIELAIEPLEKLAKSEQPGQVAFACRRLALCFVLLGDIPKAEVRSVQATDVEPTCEESWDWLHYCKHAQDVKDHGRRAYEACKQKLQFFPTARSKLFLAWDCVNLQLFDEAETILRGCLKDHPEDVACQLGFAATLLLKDDRPESAAEATRCLCRLAKSMPPCETNQQKTDLVFLGAICAALTGDTDLSFGLFTSIVNYEPKKVQKALALFDACGP
jgi:hypothetical protein